ncbi:hypothetical protein ACWCYY_18750 [Kitasatospora sp. NPDC001664]
MPQQGEQGDRGVAGGSVRRVVRWAGHPGTVLAVLVLLLNDHLWKRSWPGPVTGKVSDVAWMLVAPPVVALLLTPALRLRGHWPAVLGLAVTAVSFAVAKSGPAGGELASGVWSSGGVPSRIVGDPTDLMALPALVASWWLWRRGRELRRAPYVGLVVVPVAVAAMVATGERRQEGDGYVPPAPTTSLHLGVDADGAFLETSGGYWTSPDGGQNWKRLEAGSEDAAPFTSVEGTPGRTVCLPKAPERCYRLTRGEPPGSPAPGVMAPGETSPRPARSAPGSWATEGPTLGPGQETVDRWVVEESVHGQQDWSPVWRSAAGYRELPGTVMELATVAGPRGSTVIVHYPGAGLAVRDVDGVWKWRTYPEGLRLPAPAPPR